MSDKLIRLVDLSPELTLEEKSLVKKMFPMIKENLGKNAKTQKQELDLLSSFIGFMRICLKTA